MINYELKARLKFLTLVGFNEDGAEWMGSLQDWHMVEAQEKYYELGYE